MNTQRIEIGNMMSAHCQANVRRAIEALDGVTITEMAPGAVEVVPAEKHDITAIENAIQSAGYRVDAVREMTNEKEVTNLYKTNISCAGCVQSVTDALNNVAGVCHWDIDTASSDNILSVHFTNENENDLFEAVQGKGFKIEKV